MSARKPLRTAVAVLSLLLAGTAPGTAGASPGQPAHPAGPATKQVTLITGDRVSVTDLGGGRHGIEVTPGHGRGKIPFYQQRNRDTLTVVPADAAPLLTAGKLDQRLFDVLGLIRHGYDDAARPTLPLIVTQPAGQRIAAESLVPRATARRQLSSVDAVAAQLPKAELTAGWPGLASGAAGKIWLDGRMRATLKESVPQIGAPTAWAAGLDGKGVPVAVLDTGADTGHPDLKDVVAEAVDFTGGPNGAQDGNGHGTHVASTIAGSGAASGGTYRGAAPGSRLLVGKVLDDEGSGFDSQIIAGMEWAAAKGAKVISMSLGGGPTPGDDPMAQAVNRLTAASGALFVIAAGNSGKDLTVGSPASADAALAVGSVTKANELSDFSSRGPRVIDHAIKPEITAPGSSITAAEANTGGYITGSGTSMATPHVAGAAAILAQQHPDWKAEQLKAALMSSAKPQTGQSLFEQGAGRVDVPAAIAQRIETSPASISAYLRYPQTGSQTKTISYRNPGTEPVTLGLKLDATGPNSKVLSLNTDKVIIPAGGSAKATVTLDPKDAPPGDHTGTVTASTADGTQVLRTPVAAFVEPESYNVAIQVLGLDGQPLDGDAAEARTTLTDPVTGTEQFLIYHPDTRTWVGRAPKGSYSLSSIVHLKDATSQRSALLVEPSAVVQGEARFTLDVRKAKRATAVVEHPSAAPCLEKATTRHGVIENGTSWVRHDEGAAIELYVTPIRPTADFGYVYRATFTERSACPGVGTGTADYAYALADPHVGRVPDQLIYQPKNHDLAKVRNTYFQQPGGTSLRAQHGAFAFPPGFTTAGDSAPIVAKPGRAVRYYSGGQDLTWNDFVQWREGMAHTYENRDDGRYRAGQQYEQEWNKPAVGPMGTGSRTGNQLKLTGAFFTPAARGHWMRSVINVSSSRYRLTLSRDGKELGSVERRSGTFDVPADTGTYTLTGQATRIGDYSELASKVDAKWTFRSGPESKPRDLPLLMATATGDMALEGTAPAGRIFPLAIAVSGPYGEPTASAVGKVTVAATYDDGATWQPLPVAGIGPNRTAFAQHPRLDQTNKFVGLRISAQDNAGNKVEQTTLRAYALR